ncbi:MAG: protein-L-isoaspartate(D-aspartate) O-methyltransferase [Bacteroidota bacterium]
MNLKKIFFLIQPPYINCWLFFLIPVSLDWAKIIPLFFSQFSRFAVSLPYLSGRSLLAVLLITATFNLVFTSCSIPQTPQSNSEDWWKQEAKKMVVTQIISRGVKDTLVINAMKNTPRHLFVPQKTEKLAYSDRPLPIGGGQTISQPYIVALMTELLELNGNEKVLEIGTGSGYQAAILSQLSGTCYSIELLESLANDAKALLKQLGYDNVLVKWGDGYLGWPEHAPFDRIIVTAAPENIPEELVRQLISLQIKILFNH